MIADTEVEQPEAQEEAPPQKRPRGRPRKDHLPPKEPKTRPPKQTKRKNKLISKGITSKRCVRTATSVSAETVKKALPQSMPSDDTSERARRV